MPLNYRYQRFYQDLYNYTDYDFSQYYGDLTIALRHAFGSAHIEVPVLNGGWLVWDTGFTEADLRAFYLAHPPDPNYPYAVFGVSEFLDDLGQPVTYVYGKASPGPQPGVPAYEKYAYIFTQSIRRDPDTRIFAQVLIHELGHVRAGLTHPLDPVTRYLGYHVEEYDIQFSSCVMHSLDTLPRSDQDPKSPDIEQILDALSFCGVGRKGTETHCIHYLKESNSY